MFDEPFARGTSIVHRLDPRVRLAAAAISAIGLAVLQHPDSSCLGLALAGGLLFLSQPPLGPLLRRLAAVNLFILFIWLTVPLTMRGELLFSVGPLGVSRQGVELAFLVTVKSNAIFMFFLALVASMDSPTVGHALERLRFPPKLVFLFLFTYRYVHVIADEWHKLHTAACLRGFVPRTNGHTYRILGYMLGMVLAQSYDRSVRVYEAMLLRGFSGRFQSIAAFRALPRDICFLFLISGCIIGITLFDRYSEMFRV